MNPLPNQVYCCGTVYHLYIAILFNRAYRLAGARSLCVLQDFTPLLMDLLPRVRQQGWFDIVEPILTKSVISGAFRRAGILRKTFQRDRLIFDCIERNCRIRDYNSFITSAQINIFFNLGITSGYFIRRYPKNHIRMLEDGELNYRTRLGLLKIWKRKYLYRSFIGEGIDEEVKEIYVQEPNRLAPRIRFKGRRLDVDGLVASLSPQERAGLIRLFLDDKQMDLQGCSGATLLVTQPLSEDRFITEEEKIALYRRLLREHGGGGLVFIKAHPRETTDYSRYFNGNAVIVPRGFPLELFDLMPDVRFARGLTIWSSALNNVKCIDCKIVAGIDYDRRLALKKRFI